jgi:hypothetical protein
MSPDATKLKKSSTLLCDPLSSPSSPLSWGNADDDSPFLKNFSVKSVISGKRIGIRMVSGYHMNDLFKFAHNILHTSYLHRKNYYS